MLKSAGRILWLLLLSVFALYGCSDVKDNSAPANRAASTPSSNAAPSQVATRRGTITAGPNPIQLCHNETSGKTTITWEASGVKEMEIHIGSPNGPLFGRVPFKGSWPTGEWVANGQVFYLQDVSDGLPLTSENTLATVTVMHTKEGCK
ncbi:MAG TPA: hypothetical protein VJ464_26115 [Blastocatellia bacterium]|nr:hypothetical protein [Blastocatellia bacterium]